MHFGLIIILAVFRTPISAKGTNALDGHDGIVMRGQVIDFCRGCWFSGHIAPSGADMEDFT